MSLSTIKAKYWVVVPAAGIGSRMGASIPKQYLPLSHKTLLEHTLSRLLSLELTQKLVLVLHPQDTYWQSLPMSKNPNIKVVLGGDERSDSVLNALCSLTEYAADDDWVLVHDAARPCVSLKSIRNLCQQIENHTVGGILGVPVSDTLKKVNSNQEIMSTLDRRQLWQAQTPQIFRYGLLRHCLEQAVKEEKIITDEASAVEAYGYVPLIVAGRSDNVKITHPEDLLLAEWILQQQEKQ